MKKIFLFIALLIFCAPIFAQNPPNYTIQQYLNIRSASSPSLSKDGKRLMYLTNVSGTSQIWMLDLPNGQPKQITNYDDNIGFIARSPDGNGVVFGKAKGGDENTQFFWMTENGANVRQLTDAPQVRHNFGEWSKDGKQIYYTSNTRDKNWFDVYALNVESGKEEMLLQHDGSNSVAAVSGDNSKIIVSRSSIRFSLDNDLYLLDAKTKQTTHLTTHDAATQYSDVHFLDNNLIVLGTNQNGEFVALSRMDLATRKLEAINKANWDLDATAFSDDDKMFAYSINREGFSELYVALAASMNKELPVTLPAQGIVGGLNFSKDGTKLAFSFVSAKNNSDVWLYDLASKSLTQITKSDRAGIPQSEFIEPQLIKYKTFDGRDIPAWFYKPKSFDIAITPINSESRTFKINGKNFPVIVSVHGGPEGQERPGFNPLYQYYLSRGYAVLATNVRGSTGYGKTFTHLDDVYKREDSIKDLAYAAEWLKTSGGADAKRIGIMGGSYGGYATLAAITLYPDLWAAAVDTVGIANWESFFKNTSGYRKRQREVEYGMADKDADFLRSISPINKVGKIKTPLFVIAGRNDPRVPYTEAEQIVKALRDRNATVEYKLYDDEGHGVSKLKNRLELYPLVADFLDKYMK